MTENQFPPGWDEQSVRRFINHYETQSENEAVAEDETVLTNTTHTIAVLNHSLVIFDGQTPAPLAQLGETPRPQWLDSRLPIPISVFTNQLGLLYDADSFRISSSSAGIAC